jgi:DNA polymerase I-like protein with 3'-5' exonuclease and polymerase domains
MTHSFVDKVNKYRNALSLPWASFVIDVETTLIPDGKYETVYNRTPRYVMDGVLGTDSSWKEPKIHENVDQLISNIDYRDFIWIGHNISYDLWIYNYYKNLSEINSKDLLIWDTMLAEYLLTNQVERMPSLEKCCENYGIPMQKENEVSDLIKSGVCPSVIDKTKLAEYLKIDLLMTREVFLKQKEIFDSKPKAWQNMFINQMFFLLNTLRASWNGMKINEEFVEQNKVKLRAELAYLEGWLTASMEGMSGVPAEYWNPASNKDLTVFLYGGFKEWTEREQVGVYKTGLKVGQPRWKLNKKESVLGVRYIGQNSVDESALKECKEASSRTGDSTMVTFLDNLLKYKDTSKNYNTYFEGYMNFNNGDGYINPKYNHGLTPTGRLTCSQPNLQNIKG